MRVTSTGQWTNEFIVPILFVFDERPRVMAGMHAFVAHRTTADIQLKPEDPRVLKLLMLKVKHADETIHILTGAKRLTKAQLRKVEKWIVKKQKLATIRAKRLAAGKPSLSTSSRALTV